MRYKDSGVDIDAATRALATAKQAIAATWGAQVASDVGSFGGLYRLEDGRYLVSSIDGVGTKLKVALQAGRVGGIGEDLVNHCVNDILVQGARPLFFLDYFAAAQLDAPVFLQVIEGLARACRQNGCALIGGETAEMPGMYHGDDFDLAGCIVGEVSEDDLITGQNTEEGMEVWAWSSTGLHTNGFSLARRALFEGEDPLPLEADPGGLGASLGEALLAVHRSYLAPVNELRARTPIAALAHITGGGLIDNIPRVLPEHLAVQLDPSGWSVPAIFDWIERRGNVEPEEMRRVFNLGVGMVAMTPSISREQIAALAEPPVRIGSVIAREGGSPVRFLD